ncbi:uncharacterized protein L3040_004454 [Drepanopeziza brunnea f. sp. 'multigermtubi']|uniref:Uncharacterized protein n=1 Tax=Marssonina brunnea f. sp. multigermtubi (strain MB_m1) TaxID=1072389 RepID=K1WJP2_MARBU|nr:uncharacterized protein MBM_03687 [Drepanopeziza brunnea f. sp. 'multigermtubi' MB_m1]EKD17915.1 hypothetical protein MBM_03687 [Drepanopeziza brunnea f. sp. 'multigermtubi' MB_m1]KAJ5043067.1 hypothetical protein L3040_004454 [Drepanopeziza brunnea f. sp. 'multigermtubi']
MADHEAPLRILPEPESIGHKVALLPAKMLLLLPNSLQEFAKQFHGTQATNLAPRNTLTLSLAAWWAVLIIFYFPYSINEAPRILSVQDSATWASPLSEWPVDVVERGLNFSADVERILRSWNGKSSSEDWKGADVADDLFVRFTRLSKQQPISQNFGKISRQRSKVLSTLDHGISNYTSTLDSLAIKAISASTAAESQFRAAIQMAGRSFIYRHNPLTKNKNNPLKRILQIFSSELFFRLSEAARQAGSVHRDLVALEQSLNALANPSGKLLGESAKSKLRSAKYWEKQLGPFTSRLHLANSVEPSGTAPAKILAAYAADIAALRDSVAGSKYMLVDLRLKQYFFSLWLAKHKRFDDEKDLKGGLSRYLSIVEGGRKGLENFQLGIVER